MSKVLVSENNLTDIANAIRTQKGESSSIKYKPGQMASAISGIQTGELTAEEYTEANDDLDDILENTVVPTGTINITENGTVDVTNYVTANVSVSGSIIENCRSLFSSNYRIDIVNDLLAQCKPTDARTMFLSSTNLVNLNTMDLSGLTDINKVGDMFLGCTNLSNDSLNNILASILTITSGSFFPKELSRFGLTQTQATTCTSLSNWAACEAAGWTTGY